MRVEDLSLPAARVFSVESDLQTELLLRLYKAEAYRVTRHDARSTRHIAAVKYAPRPELALLQEVSQY